MFPEMDVSTTQHENTTSEASLLVAELKVTTHQNIQGTASGLKFTATNKMTERKEVLLVVEIL